MVSDGVAANILSGKSLTLTSGLVSDGVAANIISGKSLVLTSGIVADVISGYTLSLAGGNNAKITCVYGTSLDINGANLRTYDTGYGRFGVALHYNAPAVFGVWTGPLYLASEYTSVIISVGANEAYGTVGTVVATFASGLVTATSGNLTVDRDTVRIVTPSTPAANASGNVGDFNWDSGYLYHCLASGYWRRVAWTFYS